MMARMIIILKNEYVEKDVFLIMKESFATNITSFPINSQSLEDGFTLQKYSVKNTVWKNTLWTNTVLKRHFGKITVQRPRHSGNLKVGVRDGRANLLTGVGARDALKNHLWDLRATQCIFSSDNNDGTVPFHRFFAFALQIRSVGNNAHYLHPSHFPLLISGAIFYKSVFETFRLS